MGEKSVEKTRRVLTTGGAKAGTGYLPTQGLASTSFGKTATIPLLVGCHPDAYKPTWRLTAKDLVSDHDNALEWC